jgi:hypothetical protein
MQAKPQATEDGRSFPAPVVTGKKQAVPWDSKSDMRDPDGMAPQDLSKTKPSPRKAPSKVEKGGSDSNFDPTNATPSPPEHK